MLKESVYTLYQVDLARESSNIEGYEFTAKEVVDVYKNRVSKDNFESNSKREDLLEGHFRAFDSVIKGIDAKLSIDIIKEIHSNLMSCNFEFKARGGTAGEFKTRENIVGGRNTTLVSEVINELHNLLDNYGDSPSIEDIIGFHYTFEKIHPFQDGNGRVGRLILFREILKYHNKVGIILSSLKGDYLDSFKLGKDDFVRDIIDKGVIKLNNN